MGDTLRASANISEDLYRLTEYLAKNGYNAAHGVLGGDWGYGCEVSNETFEMHPFWWGDCECGHDDREGEWEDANPHADDCYQSELDRRSENGAKGAPWEIAPQLAAEWGLSEYGCAVHCTCGRDVRRAEWVDENHHDPACPMVRPNFRHHASGLEVRWYKYIGRSMEVVPSLPDGRRWAEMLDDCVRSVRS